MDIKATLASFDACKSHEEIAAIIARADAAIAASRASRESDLAIIARTKAYLARG